MSEVMSAIDKKLNIIEALDCSTDYDKQWKRYSPFHRECLVNPYWFQNSVEREINQELYHSICRDMFSKLNENRGMRGHVGDRWAKRPISNRELCLKIRGNEGSLRIINEGIKNLVNNRVFYRFNYKTGKYGNLSFYTYNKRILSWENVVPNSYLFPRCVMSIIESFEKDLYLRLARACQELDIKTGSKENFVFKSALWVQDLTQKMHPNISILFKDLKSFITEEISLKYINFVYDTLANLSPLYGTQELFKKGLVPEDLLAKYHETIIKGGKEENLDISFHDFKEYLVYNDTETEDKNTNPDSTIVLSGHNPSSTIVLSGHNPSSTIVLSGYPGEHDVNHCKHRHLRQSENGPKDYKNRDYKNITTPQGDSSHSFSFTEEDIMRHTIQSEIIPSERQSQIGHRVKKFDRPNEVKEISWQSICKGTKLFPFDNTDEPTIEDIMKGKGGKMVHLFKIRLYEKLPEDYHQDIGRYYSSKASGHYSGGGHAGTQIAEVLENIGLLRKEVIIGLMDFYIEEEVLKPYCYKNKELYRKSLGLEKVYQAWDKYKPIAINSFPPKPLPVKKVSKGRIPLKDRVEKTLCKASGGAEIKIARSIKNFGLLVTTIGLAKFQNKDWDTANLLVKNVFSKYVNDSYFVDLTYSRSIAYDSDLIKDKKIPMSDWYDEYKDVWRGCVSPDERGKFASQTEEMYKDFFGE